MAQKHHHQREIFDLYLDALTRVGERVSPRPARPTDLACQAEASRRFRRMVRRKNGSVDDVLSLMADGVTYESAPSMYLLAAARLVEAADHQGNEHIAENDLIELRDALATALDAVRARGITVEEPRVVSAVADAMPAALAML